MTIGSTLAQTLEKWAKKLAKETFHCIEDAQAASAQHLKTAKIQWHGVTPIIAEQVTIRRPRGRQKLGVELTAIAEYSVQWDWTAPTAKRIQQARERQATFILVTNDTPATQKLLRSGHTKRRTTTMNTAFAG